MCAGYWHSGGVCVSPCRFSWAAFPPQVSATGNEQWSHTRGPLRSNKAELEALVAAENKLQTATGVRAYGTPLANANVQKKAELTLKTFLMQDVTLDAVVLIHDSRLKLPESPQRIPLSNHLCSIIHI